MKTLKLVVVALLMVCTIQAQQPKKALIQKSSDATQQVDRVKSALAEAKIDPAQFEYSGQVTASVYLDGRNYEGDDFCLLSVVGGQLRGISRGMWFEPGKEWIHNHLTYSNFADGDTIRFRLHVAGSDTWYAFDEYVVFSVDMLIANALDPFILKCSHLLLPSALSLEPSFDVWPNPVTSFATLRYTITTDQPVFIQVIDFSGRVVQELELGNQKAGQHLEPWNTETLKQGVYHLRMRGSQISKQVVITR